MRELVSRAPLGACLVALLLATSHARAAEPDCASAYESSQEQRHQDHLRSARQSLLTCSQARCPGFIKDDCAKWLSEVDSALPTVVFSATADGRSLTDVSVRLGDEVLARGLDGKAVPMDPGPQSFVFESERYGRQQVDFVVMEGGKAQRVVAVYEAGASSDARGARSEVEASSPGGAQRTLGFALLGLGAVGVGGFAYFGLSGKSAQDALACADTRTCTDDDLRPIKDQYLFADLSLGVGVVSLVVASYLLLTSSSGEQEPPSEAERGVRVDVSARPGGAFASVQGLF
ncbi:MAG: hypothetical protein OZ921_13515 [Sorangiineae bacterium]|nr:hypothetical protein [Polyangiaceae bacterium]MEB2323524.1 hypothetical protein [Sorangiineae bacterium]